LAHIRGHRARPAFQDWYSGHRDPNPSVSASTLHGSGGRPGALEEMLRTDMRIGTRVSDVRDRVAAAKWHVIRPDHPTEEEEVFAEFAETMLLDMRQDFLNDVGDFGQMMASAFSAIWLGHWVGEINVYEDPTATLGYRLEIYHVENSTIQNWIWDDNSTRLKGIFQQTSIGNAEIMREHLIMTHYGGNFPMGEGRLRPALFWFETKKALAMSFSEQAATAKGVLVATMGNINSHEQMQEAADLVMDIETDGGIKGVIIGGNTGVDNIEYRFPTSLIDPTTYYNYFDAQVDQVFNNALMSLGLTAGSGSRALGTELSLADQEKWQSSLDSVGTLVGKQIFRWMADRLLNDDGHELIYEGRFPTLSTNSQQMQSSPTDMVEALGDAVDAGLILPTTDVREVVKDALIPQDPTE